MSTTSRFLGVGVALGLAAGLLVGMGLTQPGRATASTPTAAPRIGSDGVAAAPVSAAVTSGGSSGTASVSSGPAIAPYPFFAGSPGLAPDHTIVVTGTGQADLSAGASNQAAAQKTAIAAALADAKAQADAIAADAGLTISGVLSVSASVPSAGYGVEPPPISNGSSGPACIPVAMGAPSASAGTVVPLPACLPQPVYQQTLSVSAAVEYSIK